VLTVELTDNVDVIEVPEAIVTLVGLRDTVGPVGETVAERLIVPLNLFWLATVIVDVLAEP
jgi:hypothetical protein